MVGGFYVNPSNPEDVAMVDSVTDNAVGARAPAQVSVTASRSERRRHARLSVAPPSCDSLTEAQGYDAVQRARAAGDVCGCCFRLMTARTPIIIRPCRTHPWPFRIPRGPLDCWLTVPICSQCGHKKRAREWVKHHAARGRLKKGECRNCGRAMQYIGATRNACCEACAYMAKLETSKLNRRVEPALIECEVCTEYFVAKRTDATTCSNRCRQKLYRK